MADPKLVEQAKSAIDKILSALDISRVVCVDDAYGEALQVERIIAIANSLPLDALKKMIPASLGTLADDPDIRAQQLRRGWDHLDENGRVRLSKDIFLAGGLQDEGTETDQRYASMLGELIPREKLLTLSPMEWTEHREQLIEEAKKQRTLFLFDQDLSRDGGDSEGGIKIIVSILSAKGGKKVICGLLTHTIAPQEQAMRWKELSETYGVDSDRFVPIPKKWLEDDPLIIAHLLKLMALSPDLKVLKDETRKIIAQAAKSAANKVAAVSLCDLEHIIFRVPASEGSWEPDMLFRLHGLYHRLEARRLAHEGGKLEVLARRMRTISHIQTETESLPIQDAWSIQRNELYEPADYLNKNHLPLELGDIFAKVGSESRKQYILLAQPCDLMVRSNGKRTPDIEYITLAEIAPAREQHQYTEELHYFADGSIERYFVKLKQLHHAPSYVLDLCAFADNGQASISLVSTCPEGVRPAWSQRFLQLKNEYDKRLRKLQRLLPLKADTDDAKRVRKEISDVFLSDLLDAGLFRASISGSDGELTITYNCQRVGRLCRPYAYKLLLACTACLGRPAIDPEFGIRRKPDDH